MEDRGMLVKILELENPRARIKKIYLWFTLMVDFVLMVFLLIFYTFILETFLWYFIVMTVVVFGIGGPFAYLLLRHAFSVTTEPVKIYSNGVEAFSSPFYGLKGLNGFISKDRMDRIEVKSFAERSQRSSRKAEESSQTDSNWNLVLYTRDGGSRILGARPQQSAKNAARMMQKTWSIPVFGIDQMDVTKGPEA